MRRGERRICTVDRDALREWIPASYRPRAHLLCIFGGGTLAVLLILGWKVHDIRFVDLLAAPMMVLIGTLIEYVAHRFVMHRRVPLLSVAWDAHTGRHHHYYLADAPTWDRPADIWLVLFSPSDVALLVGILLVPAGVLHRGLPPGSWAVGVATAIVYFLAYEAIHLASHLPADHALLRVPWLAAIRQRHLRHHRLDDTHANYGVTNPLWDRVFGTERS